MMRKEREKARMKKRTMRRNQDAEQWLLIWATLLRAINNN